MGAWSYSKWDPSGNTTLFFAREEKVPRGIIRRALEPSGLCAEQAGFADLAARTLDMAGGEFCVNAARSFGACLASALDPEGGENALSLEARVSGWPGPVVLEVRGKKPLWSVTAKLSLPDCPQEDLAGGRLVRLPGISHLLLSEERFPMPADKKAAAMRLLAETGLSEEPAAGIVWWRRGRHGLQIWPVVFVRDLETLYEETACGSGTLALALARHVASGEDEFSVRQPGGDSLSVRFLREKGLCALVGGSVRLVSEGIWYA